MYSHPLLVHPASIHGKEQFRSRNGALMVDQVVAEAAQMGPHAPPTEVLFGLLFTSAFCAGLYSFWDKQIVPQKRAELAASKRKGEIKEYLEEVSMDGNRTLEQWFFNDWLNPSKEKKAAVPFLPKKKFNSGDNPVIAATALLIGFGLFTGSLEAIGKLF